MLYIVATPIGNLGDFTERAKDTLNSVDYILCEDTRTSRILLDRYQIKKPLKSFHKFNEAKEETQIFEDLANGKSIGLISDAGTPGICDPGERLIQGCIERNLPITHIPGACAIIMALVLSGMATAPFQFLGFLSKKPSEYEAALKSLLAYPGTSLFYETPHRLDKLLEMLPKNRKIAVARELTKKFEEVKRGTVLEIQEWYLTHPPKGEIVIAISEGTETLAPPLSLQEEFAAMSLNNIKESEAIKTLSQKFKLSKREIKSQLLR